MSKKVVVREGEVRSAIKQLLEQDDTPAVTTGAGEGEKPGVIPLGPVEKGGGEIMSAITCVKGPCKWYSGPPPAESEQDTRRVISLSQGESTATPGKVPADVKELYRKNGTMIAYRFGTNTWRAAPTDTQPVAPESQAFQAQMMKTLGELTLPDASLIKIMDTISKDSNWKQNFNSIRVNEATRVLGATGKPYTPVYNPNTVSTYTTSILYYIIIECLSARSVTIGKVVFESKPNKAVTLIFPDKVLTSNPSDSSLRTIIKLALTGATFEGLDNLETYIKPDLSAFADGLTVDPPGEVEGAPPGFWYLDVNAAKNIQPPPAVTAGPADLSVQNELINEVFNSDTFDDNFLIALQPGSWRGISGATPYSRLLDAYTEFYTIVNSAPRGFSNFAVKVICAKYFHYAAILSTATEEGRGLTGVLQPERIEESTHSHKLKIRYNTRRDARLVLNETQVRKIVRTALERKLKLSEASPAKYIAQPLPVNPRLAGAVPVDQGAAAGALDASKKRFISIVSDTDVVKNNFVILKKLNARPELLLTSWQKRVGPEIVNNLTAPSRSDARVAIAGLMALPEAEAKALSDVIAGTDDISNPNRLFPNQYALNTPPRAAAQARLDAVTAAYNTGAIDKLSDALNARPIDEAVKALDVELDSLNPARAAARAGVLEDLNKWVAGQPSLSGLGAFVADPGTGAIVFERKKIGTTIPEENLYKIAFEPTGAEAQTVTLTSQEKAVVDALTEKFDALKALARDANIATDEVVKQSVAVCLESAKSDVELLKAFNPAALGKLKADGTEALYGLAGADKWLEIMGTAFGKGDILPQYRTGTMANEIGRILLGAFVSPVGMLKSRIPGVRRAAQIIDEGVIAGVGSKLIDWGTSIAPPSAPGMTTWTKFLNGVSGVLDFAGKAATRYGRTGVASTSICLFIIPFIMINASEGRTSAAAAYMNALGQLLRSAALTGYAYVPIPQGLLMSIFFAWSDFSLDDEQIGMIKSICDTLEKSRGYEDLVRYLDSRAQAPENLVYFQVDSGSSATLAALSAATDKIMEKINNALPAGSEPTVENLAAARQALDEITLPAGYSLVVSPKQKVLEKLKFDMLTQMTSAIKKAMANESFALKQPSAYEPLRAEIPLAAAEGQPGYSLIAGPESASGPGETILASGWQYLTGADATDAGIITYFLKGDYMEQGARPSTLAARLEACKKYLDARIKDKESTPSAP